MIGQIATTALIAALLLWVEHWLPWRVILGHDLGRVSAYVLGVLAMVLPLSGLYWQWTSCPPGWIYAHLLALWVVIVAGGAAVISAYLFDALILRLAQLRDLRELNQKGDGHGRSLEE